jgi:hypothetical protein
MPAVAHLEWDELPVKSGTDTWSWTTDLRQDFRYSYKCTTDDNFYYATLEMDVTIPSGATFKVNTDYSDTCTVIGCKNISLSRDNNCQPTDGIARRSETTKRVPVFVPPSGLGWGAVAGIAGGALAVVVIGAALVVFVIRRRRAEPPASTREALLGEDAPIEVIGGEK